MRAGDLLRRLDSVLLPPLARGMARLAAGPVRSRGLTGAALLSVTAVLITAVWAADRRPAGDPTVGDVVRVGVIDGESIPGYVNASRNELAAMLATPAPGPAASAETYALVTLSDYLAPDGLSPVLAGVSVSEVFTRVPLPDTQTQIVRIPALSIPSDVVAGMDQVAGRKDREADDYQERSVAVPGEGESERQLRAVYDSGARVAQAEATAYRSKCSCVYAAVIRATPAALERIAARAEVRAVDPAPEVRRLDRAVFLPPLPEQEDIVRPPADLGLTTPPADLAPTSSPAPQPGATSPGTPAPTTSASSYETPTDAPPPTSAPTSPADTERAPTEDTPSDEP